MFKKSSTYFILWILFRLLVETNCQKNPPQRFGHTATLIDNKLYILGGNGGSSDGPVGTIKEFIYLDFSVKFNTKNLLWNNLTSINTVPSHLDAASVKGGVNNNTLFLYGGLGYGVNMALVYTFDPQSTCPLCSGTLPS